MLFQGLLFCCPFSGHAATNARSSCRSVHMYNLPFCISHDVACCRYLVSGADESSLYLEVNSVDGCNVRCTAQNDAVMDGLLTVTHHSANESDMMSMQADLPVLSEHDVHAIRDITSHFEVDFVSLTFTRDGEDVDGMRDFLDKLGLDQTKILAKVFD